MDRGVWQAIVHGVTKSQTLTDHHFPPNGYGSAGQMQAEGLELWGAVGGAGVSYTR